jgi:hypothetical protein
MKYLIVFGIACIVITSCNLSVNTSAKVDTELNDIQFKSVTDLVGKTIAYQYGESIYHVTFDSDSAMHWEAMAGDEKGTLEHETYVAEFIEPDMLFISWGESNGINVSQVLDFKKGVVHNHLVRDRKASVGEGEISIVKSEN